MTSVTPIDSRPNAWRGRLLVNDKRIPKRTTANVILMLTSAPEWRDVLAYDAFAERVCTTRSPPWYDEKCPPGPWTEQDDVRLVHIVERELSFSLKAGEIRGAVENVARRTTVNPLTDWLSSLEWDAGTRLNSWLSTYLGVEASPYAANVGRWFLIGAVARAYSPGCKVDHMLVLEGPQGKRKSTALRILAGEPFFSDTPIDLGSKDRFIAIQGSWIYEVAELDSFERAEVARIKSYITSALDVYRPPYARGSVRIPRRCVFAGTVNPDEYLRDPTGNRRFWPAKCSGAIDLTSLARDRAQLWAEAVQAYQGGATWWPETEEATAACVEEQAARVSVDAWQDLIESHVRELGSVTVGDVLRDALSLPVAKWDQPAQNRAARCLRALKWNRKQIRADGRRLWVYRPPESGPDVTS